MIKTIRLIVLLIFSIFFITSCCNNDLGIILFNSEPITRQNALQDEKYFKEGQRVYYLFIAPKKMNNEYIRVQAFKMTDKAAFGGYDVIRTKDYRLMLDERYYHTNYFTFYEKGRYIIQVFSNDNYQKPLAFNDFYIR